MLHFGTLDPADSSVHARISAARDCGGARPFRRIHPKTKRGQIPRSFTADPYPSHNITNRYATRTSFSAVSLCS